MACVPPGSHHRVDEVYVDLPLRQAGRDLELPVRFLQQLVQLQASLADSRTPVIMMIGCAVYIYREKDLIPR